MLDSFLDNGARSSYSMAGVGLVAAPVEKALLGITLRPGIILQPRRAVATSPWQRPWFKFDMRHGEHPIQGPFGALTETVLP